MKHITILGSTGSIGRNCLQVINAFPGDFKVVGLSTNHRVDLLYEQCLRTKPKYVCITGKDIPIEFFDKFKNLKINIEIIVVKC